MQFHLLKFFIPITILIFLYHPTSTTYVLAQDLESYYQPTVDCWTTLGCGNITNITYPFWGPNRPAYCGHPGFEINCTDDLTLLININELPYKILNVDFNSNTLTVSRTDTLCNHFSKNTTVDSNLFKFTSDLENISLYYHCQSPNASSAFVNEFTCNNNVSSGYYVTERQRIEGAVEPKCYESVVVPAFVSAVSFVYSNPSTENLREALKQGFGLQWNADNSLCESCVDSGGYCGHNSSANAFFCLCRDRSYPFVCKSTISRKYDRFSLSPAAFGIIVPVIVFSCLGCCWFFTYTKRGRLWVKSTFFRLKKTKQDEKIETFIMNYQSLIAQRYSYRDISKMTNSFVDKLGQGGFGDVYKGKLPDNRLVAVKVLNKSTSDGEEFINEVATISRTSHVNIVTLLGFCYDSSKRALIYEYLPNGSLDKYINDHNSKHLERKTLNEISIGIARGLEYLHCGCNTRIVHFDIKPHNILLDESFCPKIADFGLAKLCKGKESIVSMLGARGTAGYIAPEVFMRDFGGVSYKSDVYSYGMMILEMFAGKDTNNIDVGISQTSEIYFSDWIYKRLEPGTITRVHDDVSEEEEETVRRMIIVGLWCIQTNPTERPSMTKVIEMLEGSFESLQIPPKPCLFSASNTAPKVSSITSSSSSLYSRSTKEEEKPFSLAKAE